MVTKCITVEFRLKKDLVELMVIERISIAVWGTQASRIKNWMPTMWVEMIWVG